MGTAIAAHVEKSMSDTGFVQVACPRELIAAAKQAAAERYLSLADYVRGAMLARLHADGVEFARPRAGLGSADHRAEVAR
jgi:hypothetical protein